MEKNIGFRITVEFDCPDMMDEKIFNDEYGRDPMSAYKFISDNLNPGFDQTYRNVFDPNSLSEKETKFMDESWNNYRDLLLFCSSVIKDDKYHDFHEGNVMVFPDTGEYRLIDLEGFIVGNYNINWVDDCIIN